MTDGWWRIKQAAPNTPNGFLVTEIRVTEWENERPGGTLDVLTEPRWWTDHATLRFLYHDFREELFSWASIVHAEYQPPTDD